MSFFDEKTRGLIALQFRILQIAVGIYCVAGAEFEIIEGLHTTPNDVGWTTMQILATGLAILILDPIVDVIKLERKNEKDSSDSDRTSS